MSTNKIAVQGVIQLIEFSWDLLEFMGGGGSFQPTYIVKNQTMLCRNPFLLLCFRNLQVAKHTDTTLLSVNRAVARHEPKFIEI
jgi:hypothetical protein